MTDLQYKGVAKTNNDMPIIEMLSTPTQCTPSHVHPTLIRLGNVRRNTSRRPPQHHMVVLNNSTLDSRIV